MNPSYTKHSQASTAPDLYGEESDFSERSDHKKVDRHHHGGAYFSTQLIVNRNLTLADILVGKLVPSVLNDMKTWCLARCRDKRSFLGIVDPKGRYN
jgi:hypothetical protein